LKFICLVTLVWWSEAEQLSDEERARILEVHRKIREEVEPPASNMMLMDYSVELEKLAEIYLLNCAYTFPWVSTNPEFEDVEVNLLSGFVLEDASFEPASKFDFQKQTYNYETNACTGFCANYWRLIWATSRQVGCYRQRCKHSDIWNKSLYVMACLYKPALFNPNENPYKRGSSCSGCPEGLGCYRKQCTEMKKPGVVRVPLEESVVGEFAATKKKLIQTQEVTAKIDVP
uniref:SCP domain-containing protein n=1 Tax=Mesocestoides corti TaxID=53468 RepID=A0A5K3F7Y3_MESCO